MIVTGAGTGLGAAIAEAAVLDGHRVGVLDIDRAAASATAERIGAVALTADTSDARAIEAALDVFGDVPDVVVNDAGIVRFGPLLDVTEADWRAVVDVNLTGTFLVSRAFARRVRDAGDGHPRSIVNVTSMNGVAPGPNAGAYGSTKAALSLLTQQAAIEWAGLALRVNAVAPGLIDGGMSAPIYADADVRRARESKVPLGRLGAPADIADAVLFLASEKAAYITGQTLLVDGGVTMSIIANLPRPRAVDTVGGADGDTGRGRDDGPAS